MSDEAAGVAAESQDAAAAAPAVASRAAVSGADSVDALKAGKTMKLGKLVLAPLNISEPTMLIGIYLDHRTRAFDFLSCVLQREHVELCRPTGGPGQTSAAATFQIDFFRATSSGTSTQHLRLGMYIRALNCWRETCHEAV